jgi:hypothetical protein
MRTAGDAKTGLMLAALIIIITNTDKHSLLFNEIFFSL